MPNYPEPARTPHFGFRLASSTGLAILTCIVTAGLRSGEALGLTWADFYADAGVLRVARSLWWKAGEGARYGTPKGGKGRSIHLPPMAVEALKRHRARQSAERLAAVVWEDLGLIFTTSIGSPLRRENVYRLSFQPLLERADLPPTTRLHDLRHTCATLLLQQGMHPTLVQHLLGHASVSLTLNRYSHWTPSMGEATAAAMQSALGL